LQLTRIKPRWRSQDDEDLREGEALEELDYSIAPTPEYSIEDLINMIMVKHPRVDEGNGVKYRQFIHEVAKNF
jgi:hypothetical protein